MAAKLSPKAAFCKKFGIAPKGDGPHPASSYGLPLPPKGHPLAVPYAHAVLSRAKQALDGGNFDRADIVKQVRKANAILYGVPAPTAKQKADARKKRTERDLAYHFGESLRESLYGLTPDGSWEQLSNELNNQIQASKEFGGPVVPYGTDSEDPDVLRPGDLGIAASYPDKGEVLVANWRTGDYWTVAFMIGDDGKSVTLGKAKPAEIEVTARTKEALRSLREAGVKNPRAYRLTIPVSVREAAPNADGGWPVMAIRQGWGNPVDKNYYDAAFIESIVPLLNGTRSWFDHPSLFEEKNLPERSVLGLAGWFKNARAGTFKDPQHSELGEVPCAIADFYPVEGDDRALNLLRTCAKMAEAFPDKEPFVAYSINAYGAGAPGEQDGQQGNIISRCTALRSVDMVTDAGAAGRPVLLGESMKTKPKTKAALEAARANRVDPDLGVDVRTDAERAAEEQNLFESLTRSAVTDLLEKMPATARAAILKEAGVADPGPGKSFSQDDVDKIAGKVGMVKGGAFHKAMSDAVTTDEDSDAEPVVPSSKNMDEGEGVVGSLTADDIANLSDADRALLLKAGVQLESKRSRESATNAPAAKTAREIELEKQLAETNRKLAEATSKEDAANFRKVFESACDALDKDKRFTEAHRILCERTCQGATSNAQIGKLVRAYYDANIAGSAVTRPGGGAARTATRESRGTAAAPNFIKAR